MKKYFNSLLTNTLTILARFLRNFNLAMLGQCLGSKVGSSCNAWAMLGKQGWQLLTRPESLCARVLKGRYFHDGDFLHVQGKST
jgi:hypothetical protein